MKLKHVWVVLKKEVKDIIRDKKTLITGIVIPMILIPMMNLLVGSGVEKMQKEITENVTIGLSESSRTEEIKELVKTRIIKDKTNIKLVDIEDSIQAVREEKVRVVLDFEENYADKLKAGKPFVIKVMYDKTKTKSEGAVDIVRSAINEFNMSIVAERITTLGAEPDILQPSVIEPTNVADEKKGGNPVLGMILPLMLVVFIASGGIPAATDLIAGEKERNTFEPLLTTKPQRMSILMGKYLTVTLFSFVSVMATSAGFVISYMINPKSITMGAGDEISGFGIPSSALVLTMLIAVALGLMFAGIQIALSTYAKSFKEAQTYLGFLTIAVLVPAYSTMFMEASDIPAYMFLVPVLNAISTFKMVLGGVINYTYIAVGLVSSLVYVMITVFLAAWMFSRENVLFRS